MANLREIGYAPANPYQCILNYFKADKCQKCGDDPICYDEYIGPIDKKIIGFKHSGWNESKSDDCIKITDDVVYLKEPFDPATGTAWDLEGVICETLNGFAIPSSMIKNIDVSTYILEVNVSLQIKKAEDGKWTVGHRGSTRLISLVLEDGSELLLEKYCDTKKVCPFQAAIITADVTESTITDAFTAAGLTIESISIAPVEGSSTSSIVSMTTADDISTLIIPGVNFVQCGSCETVYYNASDVSITRVKTKKVSKTETKK